ncbi:uncharacterized protein LOC122278529 [Carya illinoinensis]|uniref:uncharacterized protein LOC122278529 n=1 Tax=Carya illinoinensis TaxID=32201 RepID=UPI001C720D38|nr:uncharacterized protein LOC122278529 [Carya illinoinensis]
MGTSSPYEAMMEMLHRLKDFLMLGVDSLVAWVIKDRHNMEFEVRERHKFAIFTRQEITRLVAENTKLSCHVEKLLTERAELNYYLGQANGHVQSLECKLDLLCEEASNLQSELLHLGSLNAKQSFALQLALSECESARTQVSDAKKELESSHKRLAVLKQHCSESAQVLAASEEGRTQLSLKLSQTKVSHEAPQWELRLQLSVSKGS